MLAPCVTAECCSRVSEYLRTLEPLDNTCFVNARVTSTQFFSSFISKFAYILSISPMNDNIVPLTHFTVRHIVSIWWESHVDAEKLINRCIVLKNIRNTHCMAVFSCSYKYKYKYKLFIEDSENYWQTIFFLKNAVLPMWLFTCLYQRHTCPLSCLVLF